MSKSKTIKTSILFLCTGNSCRSQMAEGWARQLKADTIEAYSAGIERQGLNPYAIRVMAEAGVDIAKQESTTIEELGCTDFDWVITLCGHADETCPTFPGKKIHKGFDDPPKLASGANSDEDKLVPYRKVRDEIRDYIETLPQSLPS
ncbi:MAG: arsenate reductase ArsC [Desulfocapsaceae bacterium]